MYEEPAGRTILQKVLLILLAAMAVLFAVLTALVHGQPLVRWADGLLRPSQEDSAAVYTGTIHGESAVIQVYPDGEDTVVAFTIGSRLHQTGRVVWPDGTIPREYGGSVPRIQIFLDDQLLFSGGCDKASGILYREDGSWEPEISVLIGTSYSGYWDSFELNAYDVILFALGPETTHQGSWAFYGLAVFLSLIAAVDIAFPRALFNLRYSFAVNNPEPTDLFLAMQKVGWVILVIAALILYIWGLMLVS